jgi:hypothetical protein
MSPRRPLLVNADDLEQWSDRYEAAAKLPVLVRRLVLAARGVTNVSFRTEAGVRLAGWDGFCEGTEPNPYVAVGPAGWEFSVQKTDGLVRSNRSAVARGRRELLAIVGVSVAAASAVG